MRSSRDLQVISCAFESEAGTMVIDLNYYGAKAPNYINRGGSLSEVS